MSKSRSEMLSENSQYLIQENIKTIYLVFEERALAMVTRALEG